MPDSLGYRLKIGVIIPSTNTSAQPEFDSLRIPGVTNHVSRMFIQDDSMVEQPGFDHVMHSIRRSTEPAIRSVITCAPDRIVIGVSPESYWDGPDSHKLVLDPMIEIADGLPVTMSPDAIKAALDCYPDVRRIA